MRVLTAAVLRWRSSPWTRVGLLLIVATTIATPLARPGFVGAVFTAGTDSDGNTFTAAASFALASPSGLNATSGLEGQVPVAWDPVADAEEYQVRYRLAGDPTWTEEPWTDDTSQTISALTNNELYDFSVRARNPQRTSPWAPATPVTAMPRQWAQIATAGGGDPVPWDDPPVSDEHTCAVTVSGRAYCWGDNRYGQLGSGDDVEYVTTPTPVETTSGLTDSNVVAVTTGWHHTCAVTADASAYCWGRNNSGQVGIGDDAAYVATPTPVDTTSGLTTTNVAQLSASGWHTCAVTTAGRAYCWGWNDGTLGDGTTQDRDTPTPVETTTGLTTTNVAAVAAGDEHTCAVTTAGQAYCWGRNELGQLGDGTTAAGGDPAVATPTPVDTTTGLTATNVAAITSGGYHSCAVTTAGRAYCWGTNWNGRLGNGTAADADNSAVPTPTAVDTSTGLTATNVAGIVAGTHHTCAVTTAGQGYCWGRNLSGELGSGDADLNVTTPTPIDTTTGLTTTNVAQLSAGYAYTCAATTAGQAYCWGRNDSGQLGDGTTTQRTTPTRVN